MQRRRARFANGLANGLANRLANRWAGGLAIGLGLLLGAATAHAQISPIFPVHRIPTSFVSVLWTEVCTPTCTPLPSRQRVVNASAGDEVIGVVVMTVRSLGVSRYQVSLTFDEAMGDDELDLVSASGIVPSPLLADLSPNPYATLESTTSIAGEVSTFSGRAFTSPPTWPYPALLFNSNIDIGEVRFEVNTPLDDGIDVRPLLDASPPNGSANFVSRWSGQPYTPGTGASLGISIVKFIGASVVPVTGTDTDGDTIPDASDNCPAVSNLNQDNTDNDAYGDACDNCIEVRNDNGPNDQYDTDADGFGNTCDGDFDNNNSVDVQDFLAFAGSWYLSLGDTGYDEDVDCNATDHVNLQDWLCFVHQFFQGTPGP